MTHDEYILTHDEQHILKVLRDTPNSVIHSCAWFWFGKRTLDKTKLKYLDAHIIVSPEKARFIYTQMKSAIISVSAKQLRRLFVSNKIVLEVVVDKEIVHYFWSLKK